MNATAFREGSSTADPGRAVSENDSTRKAREDTVLSPRFYTTDFEALDRIDVGPVRKEWDALMAELRLDRNRDHFVRPDGLVVEQLGVSKELAEEFSLTTAELSYLQDRRSAFENLGKRTGIGGIKAVATALIQAERYGTPVGQALRVMAKENRDMRMSEAEKKAAALPPKLTVPMIVFFLPVLFVVILGPAILQVMKLT